MESTDEQPLFGQVFESSPDAMVIAGHDGRIRFVNARAESLLGHPRQALIGEPIEMLLPARFRDAHAASRAAFAASPRPIGLDRNLDLFALRRDGTEIPVAISLSPVRTQDGGLVAATIRDLSERKALEARMQHASAVQGEFLARMSHELRTPLNSIIGFAELLQRGRAGPIAEQQNEYLGDILVSSQHLLQLLTDVLDLARMDAGTVQFVWEPVDLGAIVREAVALVQGRADDRRQQLDTFLDPSLTGIVADASRLTQVLVHYLTNAIKFTPADGRIAVRVTPDGADWFRIDVDDSGVGIPPEAVPQLFVEFQQADAPMSKDYGGPGLGLALTQRIVEGHGGRVSVRSTPGQGSTFSAILPRRSGQAPGER